MTVCAHFQTSVHFSKLMKIDYNHTEGLYEQLSQLEMNASQIPRFKRKYIISQVQGPCFNSTELTRHSQNVSCN